MGQLGYKKTLETLHTARLNWSSLPITLLLSGNPRSSTTPCWPRLECIITPAITTSWVPPVVNISASQPFRSPTLEILTSFVQCLKEKHKRHVLILMSDKVKKRKIQAEKKKKKKKKKKKS